MVKIIFVSTSGKIARIAWSRQCGERKTTWMFERRNIVIEAHRPRETSRTLKEAKDRRRGRMSIAVCPDEVLLEASLQFRAKEREIGRENVFKTEESGSLRSSRIG